MKNFFALILLIFIGQTSYAQFQYVSPLPGSTNLPPAHNIILREGNPVNPASIDTSLLSIKGSKSGIHKFRLILCDDGKTINLSPVAGFALEETVTVFITGGAF